MQIPKKYKITKNSNENIKKSCKHYVNYPLFKFLMLRSEKCCLLSVNRTNSGLKFSDIICEPFHSIVKRVIY